VSDPLDSTADPWVKLRDFTRARIGLKRSGDAMPTQDVLRFQLDHAHARDAIQGAVDFSALRERLAFGGRCLHVHSAASNRSIYIRRPDLGRRLDEPSRKSLADEFSTEPWDVVFVVADGLSSVAIEDHAAPALRACLDRLQQWKIAPIVLAEQARVALGDEVALLMNALLCVVLIGERPGLSVRNSLGMYMTWRPRRDHRDAERNCISNIHEHGLAYAQAADTLVWLLSEAKNRRLSGIALKAENLLRGSDEFPPRSPAALRAPEAPD
jgi:ethanolamine ammonia-lyase small subunit